MHITRRSEERGIAEHGWLSSRHTFSFANYYDPRFVGFRDLLVINEDKVEPGKGFGRHAHRDMEIISYVLDGAMQHNDSLGHGSVIRPGDVQRMSAGTGVVHSEYNHSRKERLHFLQIWIQPDTSGLPPSYEQKRFSVEEKRNQLRLIASRDGRQGSVKVHQDVSIYATLLEPENHVTFHLSEGRHLWLHVATGRLRADGEELKAGDAIAARDPSQIRLEGIETAEALLFDLA
ncbi:MAG: pirin family protein [Myxococcota bacterium]